MIEALVQSKADVDSQNQQGNTPLDSALVNDREQAAAVLRTVRRDSELSMDKEKEPAKMEARDYD